MAQIGQINKLIIIRILDDGACLDGGESGEIFLPLTDVPQSCRAGDELEVFVYADREDHLRATVKSPRVTVGQFAFLRVVASKMAGVYLDWGLDRDLFVPRSEQQESMKEGRSYVVFVFFDEKTKRITASSKLEKFIGLEPPDFKEGEEVDLLIYAQTDLGYKAVVNSTHGGMIYSNEVFQTLLAGQQMKGYIKKIREDGKIDLSLQRPGYGKVDDISQDILDQIKELGGRIGVTDKSPPEEIYALFGVSKKTFKKAIGSLYKQRLIVLDASGVKLAD